jgi:uncharacterized phage protein gp47/JayE
MTRIPTILELYNDIINDLETEMQVRIPLVGRYFLRALAMVQASKLKLYYLAIASVQKNIFVDTADSEADGGTLERFGRVKLNRNPFTAIQGQYTLEVVGSIGATIKSETTFKSNDENVNSGKLFILDADYTLTSTTDTITVRALEGGTNSKQFVGDKLSATAPIANVNKIGTITSETVEPLDAESLEDYRRKALESYRLEAQGGAGTDYRLWSYDAQGVEQTYPYATSGQSNEVTVYVEAELTASTDGKGTPSTPIQQAVLDVIEFDPDTTKPTNERGRRPLGIFQVNILPITVKEVDIIIENYVGLTTQIATDIENALKTEVDKLRPFVSSCDILADKNDLLDNNKIIATILNAKSGASFGAITLKIDSVVTTSYVFAFGNIPHFNSVTFI